MRRGELVTAAFTGDFGKPRPAVIVQSDLLADGDTILLCLITSALAPVSMRRVAVAANAETGLRKPSQIMVEKIFAVKRERIGEAVGSLDQATLRSLDEALALAVGLFDPR